MKQTSEHDLVLALEFANTATPYAAEMSAIGWTPEALAILTEMRKCAQDGDVSRERGTEKLNLPYARLRASLLVAESNFVSLDPSLGLRRAANAPAEPFGYLNSCKTPDSANLRDATAKWIQGRLSEWTRAYRVPDQAILRLTELIKAGKILTVQRHQVQMFPWGPGTKAPLDLFKVSAGQIAGMLMGSEIFPGAGPMLRVVGDAQNSAELFSRPRTEGGARFSVGCRITMETLPGSRQPIIHLRYFRRRWATSFVQGFVSSSSIGGFVLAYASRPNEAFPFYVKTRLNDKQRSWQTDESYSELAEQFGLEAGYENDNVVSYPGNEDSTALVMFKAGVTSMDEAPLDAGVTATDQFDASRAISATLMNRGFRLIEGHQRVSKPVAGSPASTIPRIDVFKPAMVLSRLLQDYGEALEDPSSESIDESIRRWTRKSLSEWFKKPVKGLDQRYGTPAGLVKQVVERLGVLADSGRRHLFLILDSGESSDWIKSVASMMVGDEIEVTAIQLPLGAHGARKSLEGAELSAQGRFERRVTVWRKFLASYSFGERPMFLVQARHYYEEENAFDDSVNKVAAVRTLAGAGRGTVQYLLPPGPRGMDSYLMRLQSALLDLRYGHSGCAMGVGALTEAAFPDSAHRPRVVGGIGYLQIGEGRDLTTLALASRMDIETGGTMIRLAYAEAEMVVTPWMPFDQALSYVAARGRMTVGDYKVGRALVSNLVRESLDSIAGDDPNAVIFVDATHMAKFWSSISNAKLTSGEIVVEGQGSSRWSRLRLIRTRESAPMIVQQKSAVLDGQRLEWATPVQRLIQVGGCSTPTFWSVARPMGHFKRGTSCYREKVVQRSDRTGIETYPADVSQHQTPNPVEIAILHCQESDDPTVLAGLAHRMRAGIPQARGDIWVKLPSPLHVLEKVREYLESY